MWPADLNDMQCCLLFLCGTFQLRKKTYFTVAGYNRQHSTRFVFSCTTATSVSQAVSALLNL